jgi:hypothetical protein
MVIHPVKLILIGLFIATMSIAANVPPTEKKPVTDEYHGVKIVDGIAGWRRAVPSKKFRKKRTSAGKIGGSAAVEFHAAG